MPLQLTSEVETWLHEQMRRGCTRADVARTLGIRADELRPILLSLGVPPGRRGRRAATRPRPDPLPVTFLFAGVLNELQARMLRDQGSRCDGRRLVAARVRAVFDAEASARADDPHRVNLGADAAELLREVWLDLAAAAIKQAMAMDERAAKLPRTPALRSVA